jgi:hypothetical protein
MGDQIDKLKTDMGVKAVVLRHDDHDQEMKYFMLLCWYITHNMYRPLAFSGRQIFMKFPIRLMVIISISFFHRLVKM